MNSDHPAPCPLRVFYRVLDEFGAEIIDHPLCDGNALSPYVAGAQIGDTIKDPRTFSDNPKGFVVLEGEWLIAERTWSEYSNSGENVIYTRFQLTIFLKKP